MEEVVWWVPYPLHAFLKPSQSHSLTPDQSTFKGFNSQEASNLGQGRCTVSSPETSVRSFSLAHDMGCCHGTPLHDCKTSGSGQSENTRGTNGTSGSVQFFASDENKEEFPNEVTPPVTQLKIFTYAELECATRNFRVDTILGEGGFGKVYKGWLDENIMDPLKGGDGMMIAVKRLNPESVQGFEEWESEVKFLGRLQHPNLVKLLGYCVEETELLLVYEFMARGSLEQHLFRRGPTTQEHLSWSQRLEIALGAARGLAFLHSSKIIYRDFKAPNILLDSDYNVKLCDFGLAKNGPQAGNSHVTTRIMGTPGYAAPEYVSTGRLYVKSDVYAFGVVLLEILSGQRAMDIRRPKEQRFLVEWLKPLIGQLMDPRLMEEYPLKGVDRATDLCLRCLAHNPKDRPPMDEVVGILEQIKATPEKKKNKRKPIFSATHKPQQRGDRTPPRHRFPRHAMGDNSGSPPPGM